MKTAMLAVVYGTLAGGQFHPAPTVVDDGEAWRASATLEEAEANGLGYRMLVDEPPECPSNHHAVATGYAESADGRRIARVYEVREDPPPPPRKFSKLKIYGAMASIGAWDRVKGWLETKTVGGLNGWEAFALAQEVSEDHPMFQPLAEEARRLLGLSEEQFAAMLDQCVLED